jgi:2-haloacid dehalogenase
VALDQVTEGKRPWLRIDQIYREALDMLLVRETCRGFSRPLSEMSGI